MSKLEDILAFTDITLTAHARTGVGEEEFEIELTSVLLRFVENGIPHATLKIALGESPQAGGGIERAGAHSRAKELQQGARITVKAKFKGHQTPEEKWPHEGNFDVFWGYLKQPAYTMGLGAATLVLEVDHWLRNLAATSKFSYLMHATSPVQWTRPVLTTPWTGTGPVMFDGDVDSYNPDAPDNVWKTVKMMFRQLASRDRINKKKAELIGVKRPELIKNTLALEALDLMDRGKTMDMKMPADTEGLKERIRYGLASIVAARNTGSSYWETLLTMCKEFRFSVIPTIFTATCAPVMKTASIEEATLIKASEYHQIQATGSIQPLPIRAVALFSNISWFTLDTRGMAQQEIVDNPDMIGYWDMAVDAPDDPYITSGQTIVMSAPGWLLKASGLLSIGTAFNTPVHNPIRTLANVKVKNKDLPKESPNKQYEQTIDENDPKSFGNRIAHAMLSDISWGSRTITITGRLRFDIAPGTPVKVETVGENVPFYKASGDTILYAHVVGVTVTINAEASQAYTQLMLSHVRSEAEQQAFKSLVTDTHPMYDEIWDGTSLLDGAQK